jgi:hypothetical protein
VDNGIQWGTCAEIWAGLTAPERKAVIALSDSTPQAVGVHMLAKFNSLGVILFDGSTWVLSANGALIARLCKMPLSRLKYD